MRWSTITILQNIHPIENYFLYPKQTLVNVALQEIDAREYVDIIPDIFVTREIIGGNLQV